ncbi:MAG: MFS transporter [Pseudomonadota bacterium]
MKSGSWPSIALIYLHGVLASASLSKIIPLLADLSAHLGAKPVQFGLLISLMTIPPAVLAAVAGSIIDRAGARSALTVAAVIGVVVNFAYLQASSLHTFMIIRVLEGLVVVGIYSAAPALIMATAGTARRGRAMAVWSTYTPVGMSLGLLLSAHFAGTEAWRTGYLVHLILFVVLALAGWWLPRSPVVVHAAQARPGLLSALTQAGPVRLSLTFSALLMIGFGMSTVFPDWFALQHQVSVGTASSILAMANLAMIPGGFIAGWLLARGRRDITVLATLMLLAVAVSLPLFMPGHSQLLRIVAMVVWLMTQGAAIAVVTAALPRVVVNPAQGAAAAGLLSQIAAITTFVTPLVWRPILAGGSWLPFLVVVALSAAAALMLFPRRGVPAF